MKYGIWRHENAIGNSVENTIGLAKQLKRSGDTEPEIYVEHDFQKCFALCIPGIKEENVKRFSDIGIIDANILVPEAKKRGVYMPNTYGEDAMSYPAAWADLTKSPDVTLQFPYDTYQNKFDLPRNAIVMQFRECNTFDHRVVGNNEEPERFVDIEVFHELALDYANKGYKVIRLGDKKQKPMPEHPNIIDFALFDHEEKTIMDDLYAIAESRVMLSTDSGIWVMASAMKKKLVLADITSIFYPLTLGEVDEEDGMKYHFKMQKSAVIDWLPEETTKLLFKSAGYVNGKISILNNTKEEIETKIEEMIND